MSTYFGIDGRQSRLSGMREFDADAGLRDAGIRVVSRFKIHGRWLGLLALSYTHMLGDAEDSPLVEERGDANQYLANVGLLYQF